MWGGGRPKSQPKETRLFRDSIFTLTGAVLIRVFNQDNPQSLCGYGTHNLIVLFFYFYQFPIAVNKLPHRLFLKQTKPKLITLEFRKSGIGKNL